MSVGTWSRIEQYSWKVVAAATDTAPTADTEGADLSGLEGFMVHIEAGSAYAAGNRWVCVMWNKFGNAGAGQWNLCPELDIVVPTSATTHVLSGFRVDSNVGRVAWYQTSGVASAKLFVIGSRGE